MDKTSKQHHEMTQEAETHQEWQHRHHKQHQSMIYHFNHMFEEDHLSIDYDKDGNVTFVED